MCNRSVLALLQFSLTHSVCKHLRAIFSIAYVVTKCVYVLERMLFLFVLCFRCKHCWDYKLFQLGLKRDINSILCATHEHVWLTKKMLHNRVYSTGWPLDSRMPVYYFEADLYHLHFQKIYAYNDQNSFCCQKRMEILTVFYIQATNNHPH